MLFTTRKKDPATTQVLVVDQQSISSRGVLQRSSKKPAELRLVSILLIERLSYFSLQAHKFYNFLPFYCDQISD